MFSWESRRARRRVRDSRRPELAALVESLEGRQLLAYSPLGFPLPDLTVTGFAPPVASWGKPLALTVNVANTSASSTIEPLSLTTNAVSSADSPAAVVGVYALHGPHNLAGAVRVGSLAIPAVSQNDVTQVTQTITLPNRPKGFPGDGGTIYLVFRVNDKNTFLESDTTNNSSLPVKLRIEAARPQLAVIGLDLPPVMQPGDTVQPNIRIANLGPADTISQGPVQVALVASTSPNFNSGSSFVGLYTVENVPALALAPSKTVVVGDSNLNPNSNIVTIYGDPVTLPVSPARYYLGVVIDPFHHLNQVQGQPHARQKANVPLALAHLVGPKVPFLPPAGVIDAGGTQNIPVFPYPYAGLAPGGNSAGVFPVPLAGATNATNGLNPTGTPIVQLFGVTAASVRRATSHPSSRLSTAAIFHLPRINAPTATIARGGLGSKG